MNDEFASLAFAVYGCNEGNIGLARYAYAVYLASIRFAMIQKMTCRTRRGGLAAVEMAVALPFIAILIFGIWDVGRMVEVQQLVNNAAREGARLAAVGSLLD